MKVFINARFLTQPVTGVQQFAWEICANLKAGEHEYTLLAPKGVEQPASLRHLGFKNVGKLQGYAWEQVELPAFLSRAGKPLLVNFCNTAPLLYRNQFVTIHDLSFIHHPEWYSRSFARVYNFMVPRIATRAKKVLTVSNAIREQIREMLGVEEKKIVVLYNGLSRAIMHNRQQKHTKEPVVLTVSSINPRKNLSTLVGAFGAAGLGDHKLLVAGASNKVFAGNGNDLQQNERVKLLGYVSDAELVNLYRKAKVFASFSYDEGFGIPVLEALAFGCIPVLSDIPAYRELYGDVAVFCNPADAGSCAEALKQAIKQSPADPAAAEKMFERFSYARSAAQLADLIEGKIN